MVVRSEVMLERIGVFIDSGVSVSLPNNHANQTRSSETHQA